MPNVRQPRSGSLQFWPRKRARRSYARLRTFPKRKEQGIVGFAGYKVGMTHVIAIDNSKYSKTKGEEISIPVTIVECPPLKVAGVRFYKNGQLAKKTIGECWAKIDDSMLRKVAKHKSHDLKFPEVFDNITLILYTQPSTTAIGKKKPEVFEMALGGNLDDKKAYATENYGKEIILPNAFKEGDLVDVHAVTKGKGFQGPVKRFGVAIRNSKSEKSIRFPGSLGPWCGQGHIMWRVPYAGKMGYHQRTAYNNQIIKISTDGKEVTPEGGFLNYGQIKNPYILVKGSIPGAKKRTILFKHSLRSHKRPSEAPSIEYISTRSKQGR